MKRDFISILDWTEEEIRKNLDFAGELREKQKPKHIRWQKNYNPEDYLKLIYNSSCLVGNSSSTEGCLLKKSMARAANPLTFSNASESQS